MKSFKQFIAEMSYTDATSLFGLGKSFTAAELKSVYKKMALANHPDRGGSEEMMKKVNDAYETLKKRISANGGTSTGDAVNVFRDINEWIKRMRPAVINSMMTTFNADVWLEHFNKYAPTPLKYELRPVVTRGGMSNYASFDAEFFDDERNTSLSIHVMANLVSMYNSESKLGSSDLSYPIMIRMEGYHAGKKQRFKQSEFESSSDHKVLRDPNILFPAAKLKKMFATGTTSGKQRAIKKADVLSHWKNKVGGDVWQDDYMLGGIRKNGVSSLIIRRFVMYRKAMYHISHINRVRPDNSEYFYESQYVIDMMTEIGNVYKKTTDNPAKFEAEVVKIQDKYKKLHDKELNI